MNAYVHLGKKVKIFPLNHGQDYKNRIRVIQTQQLQEREGNCFGLIDMPNSKKSPRLLRLLFNIADKIKRKGEKLPERLEKGQIELRHDNQKRISPTY